MGIRDDRILEMRHEMPRNGLALPHETGGAAKQVLDHSSHRPLSERRIEATVGVLLGVDRGRAGWQVDEFDAVGVLDHQGLGYLPAVNLFNNQPVGCWGRQSRSHADTALAVASACAGRLSWHSQTIFTRQPSARNSAATRRSRATLPANLAAQKSVLLFGNVATEQPG